MPRRSCRVRAGVPKRLERRVAFDVLENHVELGESSFAVRREFGFDDPALHRLGVPTEAIDDHPARPRGALVLVVYLLGVGLGRADLTAIAAAGGARDGRPRGHDDGRVMVGRDRCGVTHSGRTRSRDPHNGFTSIVPARNHDRCRSRDRGRAGERRFANGGRSAAARTRQTGGGDGAVPTSARRGRRCGPVPDPDRSTAGLAFWLNVYNAATQLLLERRPELFESRLRFFRAPAVTVAGVDLSLDDVEHGIMRGGRSKYGLGYLPRLARTGLDGSYRLEPDPRIHFALNCGAASCPAVLAYDPETVDETLDDATAAHLDRTVEYDADHNRVRVPRVCLWFVGDFGGPSGIRALLYEFEQVPPDSSPSLRFEEYDWTRTPRKFAD